MTRFLVAPVLACGLLSVVPAQAAAGIPEGVGQCVVVRETATQAGFQVCTPPIG